MPQLAVIPQDEFISSYWTFHAGEHTAFIGPTGTGKTTFGLKLLPASLDQNTDPALRAVVLAMKPDQLIEKMANGKTRKSTGDKTVADFGKKHGAKVIRQWPPPDVLPWQKKPTYWILWPKHEFDPDKDNYKHYEIFRKALLDCYRKGNWIVFADETYSLANELRLDKELVTVWGKARSMKTALFGATQRPTYVPRAMYSNSEHLFLWHDPDAAARKRYADIGGVNPKLVEEVTMQLPSFSCLYIRRSDRAMCIVSP